MLGDFQDYFKILSRPKFIFRIFLEFFKKYFLDLRLLPEFFKNYLRLIFTSRNF